MELTRRSVVVYGLLAAVWALVVGWQIEEHLRVREAGKTDLRNSCIEIANTLSSFIRGLRYRDTISADRIEQVLNDLVNGRTNELVKSSKLISVELLNAANERLASAGQRIDPGELGDIILKGERWEARRVTLVNPVDLGASLSSEGATNVTVVLPPRRELTNNLPDGFRGRGGPRREPRPNEGSLAYAAGDPASNPVLGPSTNAGDPAARGERRRDGDPRFRRPFWLRGMDETAYQSMLENRSLHGLVLALSTDNFEAASLRDLWLRSIIVLLTTISVLGSGLAWRNLATSSELQIRLVRASELNTHLKEMNLAAAGLAHETRNPLNIIRGLAHMISKQPDTAPEIRHKTREIIEEADKVAAQLNEFINYSRPREVRRTALALGSIVSEVVRALNYDLEEKKIRLQVIGEQLTIEADEQLLRQALFNLLLNAIQAAEAGGEISVLAEKRGASEAALEVRDNGPGVPPENRLEVFKPYFTTQKQGTGLGLAVVQQIVLAHGWEIECLANEPKGAIFRLSHLKLAA